MKAEIAYRFDLQNYRIDVPSTLSLFRKVRRVGAGEEEGLRAEEEDAADRVEEGVEAQDEAVQEEVQEVLPLALKGGPLSPCPVHTHTDDLLPSSSCQITL